MSSKDWNFNVQFPTDSNFINRITDASFGPSKSSNNPMITINCEVVAPDDAEIGGEMYNIAGAKSELYLTTKVVSGKDAEERSAAALERTKSQLRLILGADKEELISSIDPENVSQELLDALKNSCFYCMMSPKVVERRKNPTAAQIAEAKAKGIRAEGDIMKNPVTGAALVSYDPQIREIFGPAPQAASAGKPY